MSQYAKDLKLIEHNMGGVERPDDPQFGTWRLDATFRPPEFLQVAATLLYGNERVVVRGKSKEALDAFVEDNHFQTHPRLATLTISQPEKVELHERINRYRC